MFSPISVGRGCQVLGYEVDVAETQEFISLSASKAVGLRKEQGDATLVQHFPTVVKVEGRRVT